MAQDKNHIQIRLFEQINRSIPPSVSLVDELCDLLKLSFDSVYRRMNGTKLLTIEELELLCTTYQVSFDSLCRYKGNSVVFDFNPMIDANDFRNYLLSIMNDLEKVHRNKNGRVIYAGEDIPLFYNFKHDALAKFKLFYWMKFIMNVASIKDSKYNSKLISDELLAAGKELCAMYLKIPTTEIWTEVTPMSLFKQIEYFWESSLFESKEEALAICDDVGEEFRLLEIAAASGCKLDSNGNKAEGSGSYQLYCSDIEIGNNCILTEVNGAKTVYLAFNTFNKLTTHQQMFCDVTDRWLNNLISKSILISAISEKRRFQFFKSLNEGLENTRRKIIG